MAAIAKPIDQFPLLDPPPRKYRGPIVDAHMHARDLESMQTYFDVAEGVYGVRYAVPIVDYDTGRELQRVYGERVRPAIWGIYPRRDGPCLDLGRRFRAEMEAHLERVAAEGFRIVKLWFTPRFLEWSNLRLDDPALNFFFDCVRRLRLAILIHVADPDYWFAHRINDLEEHGAKPEHYLQLTRRLEEYPEIVWQVAHFAGHPEDPDHLDSLLDRYANLYLDSSATKWVAREFSRHGVAARDFLIRRADRILFGTDLVANPEREKEGKREHYASRFYVHQLMWEDAGEFASPIEDEDSDSPPRFFGLELPASVLRQLYWTNAARLYGFTESAMG